MNSLADQLEAIDGAITAPELAKLLRVSKISIYKGCKAGRIPCFRVLTSVRFAPKSVAEWLRKQ
jgi:excisionase family DNA binding protein